jgi:hypothetical protein
MTEFEVYQKVKEAINALEEYEKNLNINKGAWHSDIQKSLPTLIEKSFALGSAGKKCPYCNGSGRA